MAVKILQLIKAKAAGALKNIKAATEQYDPWRYTKTGHRKAGDRGVDSFDANDVKLQEQIDTQRRRDPVLFRGVSYYDQLGLGSGIKWSVPDEYPDVAQIVRAIWRVNEIEERQHAMAIELISSGNLFRHIPPLAKDGGDGGDEFVPAIHVMPSCQITNIATKNGEVWYYRREWNDKVYPEPAANGPQKKTAGITTKIQPMFQDILAEEINHSKMNASVGDLRGVSTLQPAVHWSQLYGRTVETVWMVAMARAMFFVHAKVSGTSSETALEDFITEIEKQMVTRTDPMGFTYDVVPVGQVLATTDDVDLKSIGGDIKGGAADNEMRRILLMAATAMGLPEFALSDGNYSNLASSMTQSNPFFRLMQAFQIKMIDAIKEDIRTCFDRLEAADRGVKVELPEGVDHVADLVELTAPDLLSTDTATLGPVLVAMVQADMISRERAASMFGEDWETISEQIKAERDDGFKAPSAPPAGPPGAPGMGLPFPPEFLNIKLADDPAKTDDGKPRHPETFEKMRKVRVGMKETLDNYRDALLAAGPNKTEQQAALAMFSAEMVDRFNVLMATSQTAGKESVPNAVND